MNRRAALLHTLSAAAAALLVAVPAQTASAFQRRDKNKNKRGGRNKGEVEGIIRDLDARTSDFRRTLDRALDRSRLDGTRKEDKLNDEARALENALDTLKRDMKKREDYWDVRDDVTRALDAARMIDRTVSRGKLDDRDTERDWKAVRRELDRVADVYDLPKI